MMVTKPMGCWNKFSMTVTYFRHADECRHLSKKLSRSYITATKHVGCWNKFSMTEYFYLTYPLVSLQVRCRYSSAWRICGKELHLHRTKKPRHNFVPGLSYFKFLLIRFSSKNREANITFWMCFEINEQVIEVRRCWIKVVIHRVIVQ